MARTKSAPLRLLAAGRRVEMAWLIEPAGGPRRRGPRTSRIRLDRGTIARVRGMHREGPLVDVHWDDGHRDPCPRILPLELSRRMDAVGGWRIVDGDSDELTATMVRAVAVAGMYRVVIG